MPATAAGASTPGALTLDGIAGVVVNAGSAFLAASSGVSLEQGKGLRIDTTGCSTGSGDNLFAGTGAGWYVPLTGILTAAQWPNTQPGPETVWSELCLMAVLDVSGINADGEGLMVGITNNTTFGLAVGGGLERNSSAVKAMQSSHGSTFGTASSTAAQLVTPGSVVPDSVAVTVSPQGGGTYWGISPGGVVYPQSWYSRDQHIAAMLLNNPLTAGGYIRNTGAIFVSVWDVNKTAIIAWVKRWTLYGRNPVQILPNAPNTSVAVAA